MRRRRYLHCGAVLATAAVAGCTELTSGGGDSPNGERGTESLPEPTAVAGWDGEALNGSALVDHHVSRLTAAGAYEFTATVETGDGGTRDLTLRGNASQDRLLGIVERAGRPDRAAYLTADRSVTRIRGEETRYQTAEDPSYSVPGQLEIYAAYRNDEYGVSLREVVDRFAFAYDEPTTLDGVPVFRFESTGAAVDDGEATLLVDRHGVVRRAEFSTDSGSATLRYGRVGDVEVTEPDWLDDAAESDGDTTTTEATPTEEDLRVDFTALQWYWEFRYPERGAATADGTLVLPVDQPVFLRGTSDDVEHALSIPEFGVTVTAVEGETDAARFTPTELGEYSFHCSEYCGTGHSEHTGTVKVVPRDQFEAWLDAH